MSTPQPRHRFGLDEYLTWERENTIKHEYVAGEVFAMAGAKDTHVTVALNVAMLLRGHLRGGPCRVYMADMKVRVEGADAFYYPDVVVTCDQRDRADEYVKRHPTLLVEVLSDSTAAYERGRKFANYRLLPELREYVVIDPDALSVDCFRRNGEGHCRTPDIAQYEMRRAEIAARPSVA